MDMSWFMYANAAMWLGLGAYILYMARAQHRLEQRLAHLETLHD